MSTHTMTEAEREKREDELQWLFQQRAVAEQHYLRQEKGTREQVDAAFAICDLDGKILVARTFLEGYVNPRR